MSLTYSGVEPQPSLAWTFESSNVDIVTGLAPSSQVSPGPAQLVGSASLVTTVAGVSNTAVYFPGISGSYMNLGTSSPTNFNHSTSNIFVEAWVNISSFSTNPMIYERYTAALFTDFNFSFNSFGVLSLVMKDGTTGTNYTASNSFGASTTTWYHVAFSYETVNKNATVFVNGFPGTAVTLPNAPRYTNTIPIMIGGMDSQSNHNLYIRDLRVVQGGVVPTTSFTPGSAPFSYASPGYVASMNVACFTLLGQFVTYVPGKYSKAIRLVNTLANPSQNYITYPLSGFDTFTGMTICFWMKMGKLQGTNTFIFQGTRWYAIVDSASKVEFVMINNVGTYRPTNINFVLVVDTWYHFAYTSINGVVSAYINGSLGASRSDASTQGVSSETSIGIASRAPGIDASLDDLRIYNTALTAAQVQSVYSSQGAPAPSRAMPLPSLAWDFNGTTTDYVSGVTPLYSGSAQTYGAGKYNQSAVFTNPVATSDTPTYYQFYATSGAFQSSVGFTFSFWFKQSDKTCLSSYQSIVGFNSTANSYFNDIFVTPGANGTIGFYGQNPAGSGIGLTIPSPVNAVVGAWYHVAFVMRTGITTMYLNGNQYGTGTYPNEFTISEVRISSTGQYTGHAFCGSVDDLRIFDQSLTSLQVQSIYNQQGVPGRGVVDGITPNITQTPVATIYGNQITPADTSPNKPTTSVSGRTTYSNAVPQYTQFGSGLTLTPATTGLTISIVFEFDGGPYYTETFFYLGGNGNYAISARLGINSSFDLVAIQAWDSTGARFMSSGNGSIPIISGWTPGTKYYWTFTILPVSSTQATSTQYRNGVQYDQTTASSAATALGNGTYTTCSIAQATGYQGSQRPANITVYDFFVLNTVLSASQVSTLYQKQLANSNYQIAPPAALTGTPLFTQLSTSATSSAVGAFSLRAVNGTSARAVNVLKYSPIDNSTSPITVSSLGTYSTYTNSPFSSSYQDGCLFGSSTTLQFPTTGKMQFDAFSSNTFIECWVYAPVTITGYPILIQKLGSASVQYQFYFNNNNSLVIQVQNSTGGTVWYSSAIGSITTGVWAHISISFYPASLKLYCSINGTVSSTTYTAFTSSYSSTTPFQIYASSFSGYISNFRVVTNASTLPYIANFTPPTTPLTTYGSGTTLALIQVPYSTQDFYADRLGNLLTAPVTGQSLASWLGGATGYVTTWYDQSGQGQHMAQSTASLQPIISLATSPPSILFTGNGTTSGQYFQNTIPFTFNFGTNYQYTLRAVVNNTVGGVLVYKGKQGAPWNGTGEKAWYLGPSSYTSTSGNYPDLVGFAEGWVITSTPITSSKTSVTWASSSFSSVAVYENASSVTPTYNRASQISDASNYLYFGITTASGVPYYNGNIYEIEIFSTPLSASDVTIMG